ncbi:MAG: tRNA (adenosine(37)-N6)-dimethylallyltransferase MiaA, partial [Candidatus Nealsonbacteria bacterium]|nr:tRNA (adenosine(37)-N6)-dimethylallyltransferase MiaA [Candidatus Nealsonbacteria bacterium]
MKSKNLSTIQNLPKIIVIVGPTASGKTALSIEIARKYDGEIVSADSRQIYRGMDIGTAKPTKEEIKTVKHYLIDIKNPDEEYTVAQYKKDAIAAIKKVLSKGKLPILIGGTGLYVKAVVDNLEIPEVRPNPRLRR